MRNGAKAASAERTAIIDVGSNSVRLVVLGQSDRAPLAMLNEKTFCSLGLGAAETGKLNPDGVTLAVRTLKRFQWLVRTSDAQRVIAFATAAVRDAEDGPEFVDMIERETGFRLRVLSGEEEAVMAGHGILFGLPQAGGVVADMGGSSLELAIVRDGDVLHGCTLPLGPLRFANQTRASGAAARETDRALKSLDWLAEARGLPLYLVGGTWRAFAKLDIDMRNYGVKIVHGYEMTVERARDVAKLISPLGPDSLSPVHAVSRRRMQALPITITVLDRLLRALKPEKLVFSAHGVREGAYFEQLPPTVVARDPLMAGAEWMAAQEARFGPEIGRQIARWITPLFPDRDARSTRLRQAACQLCDVGWRIHSDYRATIAYRHILRAPLIGLSHAERCFIAMSILRRYSLKAGGDAISDADAILSADEMHEAEMIGAALRLAMAVGGGGVDALNDIALSITDKELLLKLPADHVHLVSDSIRTKLRRLAELSGLSPNIVQAESPGRDKIQA